MLGEKVNADQEDHAHEHSDRLPPALTVYIDLFAKVFHGMDFDWIGTFENTALFNTINVDNE